MAKKKQLSTRISNTVSQLQHEQGDLRNLPSQTPRHHKLWWQSSYDRGLDILLKMWPEIKAKFPDAELHCAYGWKVFDAICAGNPERMKWKESVIEMMKQDGVFEHGRIGKKELKELRQQMGILAYPTYFTEIFMIGAIESQTDGVVPVTMALAALKETVGAGVLVEGNIDDRETKESYLKELLALMGDEDRWSEEQAKGIEFAKVYDWSKIATDWTGQFEKPNEDIKVSIVTPTIRKGFWNIMANNIATQTYKNVEWLIIDDYEQNREALAKEYANQYKLDIKYLRGKSRKVKRTYGLVNANNTGLIHSKGQLIVILQDFVLMPKDGVEQLVVLHKMHPNALLAPCDMYRAPKIKPDIESEDWFHGELDVEGEFIRANVRNKNEGIRNSDLPFEFEQNYGAVPRAIAQDLGGWIEAFDEGLGFDNTEFCFRALRAGYELIVDDTNIATCIDHWKALEGTPQHGLGRERKLNDPRYIWVMQMIEDGKLPIRITQDINDQIELLYEMPEEIPTADAVKWIRSTMDKIAFEWLEKYQKGFV